MVTVLVPIDLHSSICFCTKEVNGDKQLFYVLKE